jgi:hypothetical protein
VTDVVAALDDLRGAIAWPDEDGVDLTGPAVARIGTTPIRRRPRWPIAAAIAVGAVGLGVPAAAHYLSLGGVRITLTGEVPSSLGTELQLGEPTGLRADAPRPPALGDPAAAFEGMPAGGYTEVWPGPVLVTSFPGEVGPEVIGKLGTAVAATSVDGEPAYWIAGPHAFMYYDDDGQAREDTVRLSGGALVWTRDGTTYRIETPEKTLAETVALAESMF